ncbi:nitroreductase [Spirochaetia bacterium]|nr:nitroreductase [Spirochaetia bacterium]
MLNNETLKTIKRRRSIRSYRQEQIPVEALNAVTEAGLYAPYGVEQNIHFTVIQNRVLLEKLNTAAKEVAGQTEIEHIKRLGNDPGFNCLYNAPVLIIVSAKKNSVCPEMNSAAASENMLLAAESIGLGSCWIYFVLQAFDGDQKNMLLKELKIPEGYAPYTAIVLGYKQDEKTSIPKREKGLVTLIG